MAKKYKVYERKPRKKLPGGKWKSKDEYPPKYKVYKRKRPKKRSES